MHLLSKKAWPGNHYATDGMRIHYFHRQARGALYGASLALLLIATVIGGTKMVAAYVKDAVDLVRELDESIVATPEQLILLAGDVLTRHPHITVGEMRWVSDSDAQASPANQSQIRRGRRDDELIAGERHQVALMKGQVIDFGRSYRGAVSLFGSFVRELRRDDRFSVVEVRRTPFDIDPQAAIIGTSGVGASPSSRDRAGYELLLRIKHSDGNA